MQLPNGRGTSASRYATLAAVVALLAAACGGGAGPQAGETTPGDQAATTPAPTATGTEQADGRATPQGEPVNIGFFAPLTGPAASDGESAKRGAELATTIVNEAGGVLGRPVELVVYDDAFSPDEAANVTRRLIEQDDVAAVVSGSYSFTTRAAGPIAQRAGVPLMAAYAVHPTIPEIGEYVWQLGLNAAVQGEVGGQLTVDNIGAQRIAMLVIDNDFGAALADAFAPKARELGAEIVYRQRYPLGSTDFQALLPDIQAAEPDAIYAIGYYNEAAAFVEQAAQAGIEAQIVGQEGYDTPIFLELAGQDASGVIFTTSLDRGSDREPVQRFLRRFEDAYGEKADAVAASTFDSVQVLAHAMNETGSTEPGSILTGLRELENYEPAVTGPLVRFTDGRKAIHPVKAQVVRDGQFQSHATYTDQDLIVPQ